jgi:hypothetical protein
MLDFSISFTSLLDPTQSQMWYLFYLKIQYLINIMFYKHENVKA